MHIHGTSRERYIFEKILAGVTPPEERVQQYELNASYFRNELMRSARGDGFHSASLRTSVLFGKRYLCLYLDDERFRIAGHDYNAFCRASWGLFHSPVICLPRSRVRDRSQRFRSIVEHEMVHANQAMLGRLPASALERDDIWAILGGKERIPRAATASAEDAAADVKAHATAEFEAYFLQKARWPQEREPQEGCITEFTLFKLCFAQGWVDALHRLLMGAYCRPDLVVTVLEELHRSMHSLLISIDAESEDADWFKNDQRRLVKSVARGAQEANGPRAYWEAAIGWATS